MSGGVTNDTNGQEYIYENRRIVDSTVLGLADIWKWEDIWIDLDPIWTEVKNTILLFLEDGTQ